jgi:hypothetical protein
LISNALSYFGIEKLINRNGYMHLELKTLTFIVFFLFSCGFNILFAQKDMSDTVRLSSDKKKQIDVRDIFRLITKKQEKIVKDSTKKKSLGPFYTPIVYPGYALVTGYLVGLANNISFYTHNGKDAKISNILIDNIYTQYKQYINIARSNIWLNHEKFNLLGDWRYYKFPTNTFGLGSTTSLNDKDPVDYSHLRINEVIMGKIAKNFSGGMGFNLDYYWNVKEINNSASISTDLDKYGLFKKSLSSGLTINFQYDDRLNSNNPSRGTYANLQIVNNLKAFGSDNNWQSAILDAREYIKIPKKSGNVLALWSYDWFTLSGIPPYFDLPCTGWDTYNNTAREYVEARFRGLNLIYAEAEYRFRLTKNGLFGGVVFSNVSSLTEWPNNKFEKVNPGYGLGLRIKINKSSNTNLCIDYGFGTDGSRGFSFNVNEVF